MAKQTQIINRFDAGLIDQFSQQDIPDNALVRADNVMVDKPGRIRLAGAPEDAGFENVTGTTTPGYGMFIFQSDFDNPLSSTELSPNSTADLTGGFEADDDLAALTVVTATAGIYIHQDAGNSDAAGRWFLQNEAGNNTFAEGRGWYYSTGSHYLEGATDGTNTGTKYAYTTCKGLIKPGRAYRVEYKCTVSGIGSSNVKAWCHGGINTITGNSLGTARTASGTYIEYFDVNENANGQIGIAIADASAAAGILILYYSVTQVPSIIDTSYIAFQNENVTYLRDTTNNIWRKEALGQVSGTDTHGPINMSVSNFPYTKHDHSNPRPVFYIADGILRVCDANFNNSGTMSKWYGILDRTFFADTTGNGMWRTWYSGDQKIYAPTGSSHISIGGGAEACDTTANEATVALDGTLGDDIYVGSYVSGAGVFPETVVAAINAGTEGSSVSSFELSKKAYAAADEVALTFARKLNYYPGKATILNNDSSGSSYPNLGTVSTDGIKFHYGLDASSAGTDGSWESSSYKFYASYLYDKSKQESGLYSLGTETNGAANRGLACGISVKYYDTTKTVYLFNERVTGARIYYTDANDADGLYYQLLEIDFEKGVRKYDELEFTDWAEISGSEGSVVECPEDSVSDTSALTNTFHFLHPPKVLTYQTLNGYDADEETIFKYKTAVIANRRCYIGNVARLDTTGAANRIKEKFNDRIIKSPVNKFDTFPEGNFLDVTVNDGDEIVRLEVFADRLMQFKRRKMFIINVSQDVEFLESEHNFMGVDHHAAVTKTEIGILWTNTRGCYLYDGRQIRNLIDNKISPKSWGEFLSVSGMVGYIPDKKQIIVVKDPGQLEGDCFLYDVTTTSWTFGSNLLSSLTKTNMSNDKFGNLIWAEYANEGANKVIADVIQDGGGYSETVQNGAIGVKPKVTLTFKCPHDYYIDTDFSPHGGP